MSIDSCLPAADLLPVIYGQRLPERYVFSPVNRIYEKNLHHDQKVIDSADYRDKEESLSYGKDMMSGSVKIVTMTSINPKGRHVDVMA
jgi:hypothetical protein